MWIRINNINLDIDEDLSNLNKIASKKLKIKDSDIKELRVVKESIDARKKNNIKFNYAIDVKCDNAERIVKKINSNDVKIEEKVYAPEFTFGTEKLQKRPNIIGLYPF